MATDEDGTPAGTVRVLATGGAVRSLAWAGGALVDWVAGGERYGLDGSHERAHRRYAYRFDSAVATPDGEVAVIYERGGTKGLVLRSGAPVREIDRSFYQAHRYAYPVCLWSRGDRVLLVHCPDEYNRIEIEDALTGERLTARPEGDAADFFHSRLEVSPGGRRLLSAGWIWHPWDAVAFFDLEEALREPRRLDTQEDAHPVAPHVGAIQEATATWLTDDRLILTADGGPRDGEPEGEGLALQPSGVVVYDVPARRCVSSCVLERPAGRVMRVGAEHVLALYEHPRLRRLEDGAEVASWPELPSGTELSCIFCADAPPPPMALDPDRARIAIAREGEIHVITFGDPTA